MVTAQHDPNEPSAAVADYTHSQLATPRAIDGAFDRSRMPKKGEPMANPFKTVSTAHRVTQSRRIGAETPGQYNRCFEVAYCSVGAAWRVSLGCVEGWQFYRSQGGAPDAVPFDHPDAWRLETMLDFWHPKHKNDSQQGQFVIFWHKLGKALDAARIVAVLDLAHDVDYDWRSDANEYPKEDVMPGLPPLPHDLTVRARLHEPKRAAWIDDPELLNKFHKRWNDIYNERVAKAGAPAGEATKYRHDWQKRNIDSEHLKESTWNNTAQALLKALTGSLDFDYPLPAENAPEAPRTVETTTPATGIPATPSDAPAPAAPRSETTAVEPLVQQEKTVIPEKPNEVMPYSAKFSLISQRGVRVEFAIVAPSASDLVQRTDQMVDHLLDSGWKTTRNDEIAGMPVDTPAPAQTPVTTAASSGLSDCFMLKIGKTFKGDKDQVVFECSGVDDAKFSSRNIADILQKVSGLRKPDGSVITPNDLINGAKVPVRGKVQWQRSDDGKYINVISTQAA